MDLALLIIHDLAEYPPKTHLGKEKGGEEEEEEEEEERKKNLIPSQNLPGTKFKSLTHYSYYLPPILPIFH